MIKQVTIENPAGIQLSLEDFYLKKVDLQSLKNLTPALVCDELKQAILTLAQTHSNKKLQLPDGYFLPLPYSTINERFENDSEAVSNYLDTAGFVIENFKISSGQTSLFQWFESLLHQTFQEKPSLLHFNNRSFAPFGIRFLEAEKNGIDIHCENAFLHQLAPSFRNWLYQQVDIENSISFFLVLQGPIQGGELVVYSIDWDSFPLKLDTTNYEERHDVNGSLFKNRNLHHFQTEFFPMQTGEAIVFRAAQLWHAIHAIGPGQNRITIGCFLAKGRDGNFYYWA
ncbi:MAG: hypothetical protein K1X82_08585 [Bacteroidia bacterium]|nr:hypothetical protein [Bacteroidia bacterium]